jgi:hypothetical protein
MRGNVLLCDLRFQKGNNKKGGVNITPPFRKFEVK